jgi:hypothetical protein
MRETPQHLKLEKRRIRQQKAIQRRRIKQQAQEKESKQGKVPKTTKRKGPRTTTGIAKNLGWRPDEDVVEKYNKTAYIIGGGPSLEFFNWNLLNETKFVVGINRAYEVCPTAQIIYFTDDDWYALHKKRNFLQHSAVKIKGSLNPSKLGNDTAIRQMHLTGEKGLDMKPNRLKHGRNSPYAATNMLIQWGFKKIYLMGIDLKYGRKDPNGPRNRKTHWHDGHRRIDGEGTFKSFARNYKDLPNLISPHGVIIININDSSGLKTFPTETYEEHFGPTWTTRHKT